ncbi:hypothetical protein M1D89_07340 [Arthrobacter sp. D3-18]
MSWIATACPFIVAIFFILIAPKIVTRVSKTIQGQITQDRDRWNVSPDAEVPPHLSPKAINDYIEYAADAVQIFPATLLPIVGAVFTISNNGATWLNMSLLILVVLLAIGLDVMVATRSTADYVSRRKYGYSVGAIVALLSNLLGLIVVIVNASPAA